MERYMPFRRMFNEICLLSIAVLIIFSPNTHGAICPSCGDVNLDDELTPADALCAFQRYLGIPSCIQGDECKFDEADVTQDDEITPADALCIFQKYLEIPSCLDGRPECPWD